MSEGFLGRWSKRKQEAREAAPERQAAPPVTPPIPLPDDGAVALAPADRVPAAGAADDADAPPALTLADTESLTLASDFKPFLAQNVAPEVKNAAFKKLFADPHFNVMDRLDIYIDDYSIPSPLPESVLRQMASAKFLNLFAEEEAPAHGSGADVALREETPRSEVLASDVAQSEASGDPPSPLVADAQPASQKTDDPNADLRLQPDDAARAEDARHRTG
jgi:hypothetical protein